MLNRHVVVNEYDSAVPGTQCQILLDAGLVGVLHVLEQIEVFEVGGNRRVADDDRELALVVAARLVNGGVECGRAHQGRVSRLRRDVGGVAGDELLVFGAGH